MVYVTSASIVQVQSLCVLAHLMPARTKKAAAKPAAAIPSSSDSETNAGAHVSDDSSSEEGSEDRTDESGNDSDSLDSSAPRKRRRISPDLPSEDKDEDDEIPTTTATFISAPSRIRKRNAVNLKPTPQDISKVADPPAAVFGGTTTAPTDPNTNFEALGVHPWLVQSLTNMAIRRPTGIQKGCIPEILKGRDCIGGSRTGSGKTVAFAVPILQKWAEDPSAIFAVVLTPTR